MSENLADLVNPRDAVRDHISLLTVSRTNQSVTLLIPQTSHMVFVLNPITSFSKILSVVYSLFVPLSHGGDTGEASDSASLPEKQGVSQEKSHDIELTDLWALTNERIVLCVATCDLPWPLGKVQCTNLNLFWVHPCHHLMSLPCSSKCYLFQGRNMKKSEFLCHLWCLQENLGDEDFIPQMLG